MEFLGSKGYSKEPFKARIPAKCLLYLEYLRKLFYTQKTFKGVSRIQRGLPNAEDLQRAFYIRKNFKLYTKDFRSLFYAQRTLKGYSIHTSSLNDSISFKGTFIFPKPSKGLPYPEEL